MGLGGKDDESLQHAVAAVEALEQLRILAKAAQHPIQGAVQHVHLELAELLKVGSSNGKLAAAIGEAGKTVCTLMGSAPSEFYKHIAEVLQATTQVALIKARSATS